MAPAAALGHDKDEVHQTSSSFTGLHWISLNFTGVYQTSPEFIGVALHLVNSIDFQWNYINLQSVELL